MEEPDPSVYQSPDFCNRFASLDLTIQHFFASLPHLRSLATASKTQSTIQAQQLLVVVNLTALAQITLHRPFSSSYPQSNKKCVDYAIQAVQDSEGVEYLEVMNPVYIVGTTTFRNLMHNCDTSS